MTDETASGDLLTWHDARVHPYPLGSLHRDDRMQKPARDPQSPAGRAARPAPLTRAERGAPRGRVRPIEWLPWSDPWEIEAASALCQFDAFVDGSGTTADAVAGIGVAIVADGMVVTEASVCIGLGTNNRAEVAAIGHAIGVAWRLCGGKRSLPRVPLTIHSDSEFALSAVNPCSNYNIRAQGLYELVLRVRSALVQYGPVTLAHTKGHRKLPGVDAYDELRIRGNNRADELAGLARRAGIARIERPLRTET